MLVRSGAVDVVAMDSVAALTRGSSSRARWGISRRSAGPADVAGDAEARRQPHRNQTMCLFTNQIREKVGVMFGCFH